MSLDSYVPSARERDAGEPRSRAAQVRAIARRVFNVATAVFGLLVLAVPLTLIVAAIKSTSAGPAFFRQIRVGRGGRLFRIYKFRTMIENDAPEGEKVGIGAHGSVTLVGRLLRETKIDEIPQLINVIIGDMNLVGPRPELPEFVAEYSARDRRIILSVEPGLTDFASIRFRHEGMLLTAQEDALAYYHRVVMPAKLRYCRFYVRRASLALDVYLIGLTIFALSKDLRDWIASRMAKSVSFMNEPARQYNAPLGRLRRILPRRGNGHNRLESRIV